MKLDRPPLGRIASLAAAAEKSIGTIDVVSNRTLMVSVKGTSHADATDPIRANLYYSPDGVNYDTVPYATFDVDLSAGSATMESHVIDSPETGILKLKIKNVDAAQVATDIIVWASAKKWEGD